MNFLYLFFINYYFEYFMILYKYKDFLRLIEYKFLSFLINILLKIWIIWYCVFKFEIFLLIKIFRNFRVKLIKLKNIVIFK